MVLVVAIADDDLQPLLAPESGKAPRIVYQSFPTPQTNPSSLEDALSPPDSRISYQELSTGRLILLVLSLGILLFIQASNITIISTTQGVIAADLNAFESASWFTSAYLVAASSVAPLNGRLSDIFQPRYCIFVSSIISALGSTTAGLAPNLFTFLVGRAITGVGSAGTMTVSAILVVQLTTPERRGLGTGILNTAITIGVALGAVLAGALQPVIGWRALFWAQAPMAVTAGSCLLCAIPANSNASSHVSSKYHGQSVAQRLRKLDYIGALLLVMSLVSLLYGLSTPRITIAAIILFIFVFPVFLYHETYSASDPIIPVALFSSRGALLTCLATVGFMTSRWNILFYTPMYATAVRGWSPASAGSILVPTNVGFALGSLIPGFLHIRRGGSFYTSCLVIFAVFPLSLASLAIESTATSPTWLYVLYIFINGFLGGAAMNYTLAHVLHLVPSELRFVTTSLIITFRGFAGTFGSAIGGGIFTRSLRSRLLKEFAAHRIPLGPHEKELTRTLMGSPRVVQGLQGVEHDIAVRSYEYAIKTLVLSGAAMAAVAFFLQAGTGRDAPKDAIEDGSREDERGRQEVGGSPAHVR